MGQRECRYAAKEGHWHSLIESVADRPRAVEIQKPPIATEVLEV